MGDGQSIKTSGKYVFQTYSVSFSEPWFGQKKPVHLVLPYLTVNNF
jgi:outer membrane protein insertion porin family